VDEHFWQYLEGFLLMEKFETDRFLTDFSRAWTKQDLDAEPPRYALDEAIAYFNQQKQTSTTVDIGEGDVHIVSSEGSDRIYIHTNRGIAELGRDDLPDIIRVLQGLVAGRTTGGALNAPQIASKPIPGQNELAAREARPNHPGYKSQAEKNDESLKRALGLR
jgi:hypothetical protein